MSQSVSVRHNTTGCARPYGKRRKPPSLRLSMSGALPEAVYFAIASRTSGGNSSSNVVVDGGVTGVAGGSATGCACTRAACGAGDEVTKRVRRAAHPASSAKQEQEKERERDAIQHA